ncbi:MAG: hypothetical protein J5651_00885 [Salinivirgaceae bacterium]|nr:hypothetical protein [Salinivirgaceae bacterium]
MKKAIQIVFVTVVCLILLFPIIGFNGKGEVSELENRKLAEKPKFSWKSFVPYDSYFQDRFGGRESLVELANWFDYEILHRSLHNNLAIGGRHGWLFYTDADDGDNLADFNKKNLLNNDQLEQLESNIQSVVEWCNANNLKYLFLICPNKHSVYPENYPYSRPAGKTRLFQIDSVFRSLGVVYVNPCDTLICLKNREKLPLYYETDTHWNPVGAYYAAQMIKAAIEKLFPDIEFPEWNKNVEVGYSNTEGDIMPLLNLKKAKSTRPIVKDGANLFTDYYERVESDVEGRFQTHTGNKKLPTAIVFRDSFGSALVPYLSTLFANADYNWKQFRDDDKEYVLQSKPDIVIFEAVERYSWSIVAE